MCSSNKTLTWELNNPITQKSGQQNALSIWRGTSQHADQGDNLGDVHLNTPIRTLIRERSIPPIKNHLTYAVIPQEKLSQFRSFILVSLIYNYGKFYLYY